VASPSSVAAWIGHRLVEAGARGTPAEVFSVSQVDTWACRSSIADADVIKFVHRLEGASRNGPSVIMVESHALRGRIDSPSWA